MSNQPDDLESRFQVLLDFLDVEQRSRRNKKIPPVFHVLYISLIEMYPGLLDSEPCKVLIWKVRENAGWVSARSATNFFQDMATLGAITYEPCPGDVEAERWEAWVVPHDDIFPYPEMFDFLSTERRKRAREKERERRNRRALVTYCEKCGSPSMTYDLHPVCGSCGHKHAIETVRVNQITLVSVEDGLSEIFEKEGEQ
jgi:hypothetical protein